MADWNELLSDEVVSVLRSGIEPRLQSGETFEAAMTATFAVAKVRAQHFQREVLPLDVEVVAAGLCWWPMKPAVGARYRAQAAGERQHLIELTDSGFDVANYLNQELAELEVIQPLVQYPADAVMAHLNEIAGTNQMEWFDELSPADEEGPTEGNTMEAGATE